MPKIFNSSFISEGRFFKVFEPIDDSDIRPFMLKYATKSKEPSKMEYYQFSTPPDDRRRRRALEKQVAQMEAANQEPESEPQSEAVKEAVENITESMRADFELRKASFEAHVKHDDMLHKELIRAHDEKMESGEFDSFDQTPEEEVPNGTSAEEESESQAETPKAAASSNCSIKPKESKLYCRRDGKFVLISQVNDLQVGEDIFRLRPRSFGQAQTFIRHGAHQIKLKEKLDYEIQPC